MVITAARPGQFVGHADRSDLDRVGRGEIEEPSERVGELARGAPPDRVDPAAGGRGDRSAAPGAAAARSRSACTLRIGSPRAEFCQMEIVRGAIPGAGASQRLPRLIGFGRAAEMILTRRFYRRAGGEGDWAAECAPRRSRLSASGARMGGRAGGASPPVAPLSLPSARSTRGASFPLLDALEHEQRLFLDVFSPLRTVAGDETGRVQGAALCAARRERRGERRPPEGHRRSRIPRPARIPFVIPGQWRGDEQVASARRGGQVD